VDGSRALLDDLSAIDEYGLTVAAPPDIVWDATLASLEASFSAPWPRRLARLLGTDPALASGWKRPAVGSAIPGFRIVAAHRPDLLVISGSHRFSRYGIVFRIEPLAEGARCRAESRAGFPGLLGGLYRLAVVGSGGHVVAVRRMLLGIKRAAERSAGVRGPDGLAGLALALAVGPRSPAS
jgi:hypothetical protein